MRARRVIVTSFLALCAASCASTPGSSNGNAGEVPVSPAAVPQEIIATVPNDVPASVRGPVGQGELPWWHNVRPGTYRFRDSRTVLATGGSSEHHHVAEGYMSAKVTARLGVRKAAERIGFEGTMPEPELLDLFITRDQRFFALYGLTVPPRAEVQGEIVDLVPPEIVRANGRRRIGRHIYEDDVHLFLECDVEGPVANPNWGRARAAARP